MQTKVARCRVLSVSIIPAVSINLDAISLLLVSQVNESRSVPYEVS
jgi:hypothetical protein